MNKKTISNLMLLLTAFIWGVAFIAQSVGMDHLGPFAFTSIRNFLGGAALLPVVRFFRKGEKLTPEKRRVTIIGGICCGVVLFCGSMLQQIGIQYTSVGKTSFITALYIVIVPILGLFLKKRASALVWVAAMLGAAGLFLLSFPIGQETFSLNKGDLYVLCCTVLFATHILVIDHFTQRVDRIMMSSIQFFVAGFLALIFTVALERPSMADIAACWWPLLYAGLFSSAVGYTMQIVGQKNTDPAVASLILSLESAFGALAGVLLLGEAFSRREVLGMALMFFAILLSQWPGKVRRAKEA